MPRNAFLLTLLILFSACTSYPLQQDAEEAFVARVIDGDTFVLSSGERVRLIGINAPEKEEQCFEESKQALVLLLENRNILLQKDVSETDKYGRLLRYVFVEDFFVNKFLVEAVCSCSQLPW